MLNYNIFSKPWCACIRAFFVGIFFVLYTAKLTAQNVLEKQLPLDEIKTISINGNHIFKISVSTTKTHHISVRSLTDGDYQNLFQIVALKDNEGLKISLKPVPFMSHSDDKRNAHKVIAAAIKLEIPEHLNLKIESDIGSVYLNGAFRNLMVSLAQGGFQFSGITDLAEIKTIDGNIKIATKNAHINANAHHGTVNLADFVNTKSQWVIESIHGNITVSKL